MENKVSFYNTLTKKVERFIPNEEGKASMYTCGPTVYHYAHIGNLRSYIMEDLLEKVINQNFVPVIDDRNVFIGIVTRSDIIKYFVDKSGGNSRHT